MKSIIMLFIQIELKLQSIRNVLRAKYDNFITFLKLIIITKENDVINFNAITQLWNSSKKNSLKWLA